jgi:hypothetical protein
MTKREVVAVALRKAIKRGDIEAIKLAMLIDQDPASDEPIDEAKETERFWVKAKKDLARDIERWELEGRLLKEPSISLRSDEGASSDNTATLDPEEVPTEEHDDERA